MLFLCSSRIYLTEMSIPPDYINQHSSNSTSFEAQKVLLQQQRTRTPGSRSRVYCQSQERAKQQAQNSLSVPESGERQIPGMMGVAGLLVDSRNAIMCSWPPTALCLMHTHIIPLLCLRVPVLQLVFMLSKCSARGLCQTLTKQHMRVISNSWEELLLVTSGQKAGEEISVVPISCAGHHSASQFAVQRSPPHSGSCWKLWQTFLNAGTGNLHITWRASL